MSEEKFGDFTPVVRVEVKRADVPSIVREDPVLRGADFCVALGAGLDAILKRSVARRYPDKLVVFQTGDSGSSLFFILSGELRLYARKEKDVVELPVARRGEVVGESEVLDGSGIRTLAAVAQGPVEMTEVPREALLQGGRMAPMVAAYLEGLKKKRHASLDELNDFLNRW